MGCQYIFLLLLLCIYYSVLGDEHIFLIYYLEYPKVEAAIATMSHIQSFDP